MEDNKRFLKLLKPVQRQLAAEQIMREAQLFLCFAAAWAALLLLTARFIVIPFYSRYFFIGLAALLIIQLIRTWRRLPGWREAAYMYNRFVPEDRVITGFGLLDQEGPLEKLQVQEALQHMLKRQQDVLKRKKTLMVPKWSTLGAVISALSIALYLMPSEKIELARMKEEDKQLVKKIEKQLEEKVKEAKDPDVKKALKEAEKKISTADSAEEALKELAKQTKNLELKALKKKEGQAALKDWQAGLKDAGLNELANLLAKQDLKGIEKELQKLNQNWNSLTKQQQAALKEMSNKEKQLSEEELAAMSKAIEEALKSPDILKKLADAQSSLQNTGLSLQKQMAANGTPPSQLAFSSSNGSKSSSSAQQPSSSGNGSQTGSGNNSSPGGNPSGSGNGNGSGSGSGNGNGSGSGSGSGNGTGRGSGAGGGLGSGAGLGQGSREMLTIPEYTDGKTNVETDGGKLGSGNAVEQSEGNGPVLKGALRPYSEVYGQYEAAFRQSTERYKLPSELEEMVQNYFTNIDPNRE